MKLPNKYGVTTGDPSTEFDFSRVDDPESCALEELRAIARDRRYPIELQPLHARVALEWAANHGIGPGDPIFERVALWLGGSKQAKDIGFRAAVFIHTFAPLAQHYCTLRQLGEIYGVTRQGVQRLVVHLRTTLFDQSCTVGPGGEVIRPREPTNTGLK